MKTSTKLTLKYYDENTKHFIENTLGVDFGKLQKEFTSLVPKGGTILDLGCGSCRDSLAFKKMGYTVIAIDGSKKLCDEGEKILSQKVINMKFEDYNLKDKLDGIWACASLLHLEKDEIEDVIKKISKNLKKDRYIYMSFKYGEFEGIRNRRYYTDMTEKSIKKIIDKIDGLKIEKSYISFDTRYKNLDERWLNVYVKKYY